MLSIYFKIQTILYVLLIFWAVCFSGASTNTWGYQLFCLFSLVMLLLRTESPSGKRVKLRTVATSNNRDHTPRSPYYCLFAPGIYSVFLRAHSVRGEPRIPTKRQRSGCSTSLCSSCICSSSVIFVWSYKVTFSKKQSHTINFLGHKNGPNDEVCPSKNQETRKVLLKGWLIVLDDILDVCSSCF